MMAVSERCGHLNQIKKEPTFVITVSEADSLRKLAEGRIQLGQSATANHHKNEGRLLYELQVHQVELEIQMEELRASNGRTQAALEAYEDMFDYSPVGLFTVSIEGFIVNANLTLSILLGTTVAQILGKPLPLFMDENSASRWHLFLVNFQNGLRRDVCELQLQHRNNGPQPVSLHCVQFSGYGNAFVRGAVIPNHTGP